MKMIKTFIRLVIAIGLMLTIATPTKAQTMLEVKTTFYPVYYLAQRIAGDNANVTMLLDGGEDAHSYESSAQDAVEVQEADLFIYQDDEMEFFVQDLLSLVDTSQTAVLESTHGIGLLSGDGHNHAHHEEEQGHAEHHHEEENHAHGEDEEAHSHGHEGHTHEYDPHTWLDPMVYAQQAENVRDALINVDPDNQATYEENTELLIQELTELDEEFQTQLADLENRTIVVQHAAFGYLTHAYDLHQEAIAGLSTGQEPAASELAQMQEYVVDNDVQVIYVDPASDPAIAETVASANEAQLLPLRTLEVVTPQEQAEGIDYFTIMRENLNLLMQNQ